MSDSGVESTLSTYTASDGDNLAVQDWHLPLGSRPRAAVLVVHGLGEHAGRYDLMARRLNAWGFAVRAYDQYGHGESGGVRGALPQPARLVDDLCDLVDATRRRHPGAPLIVLGHSMGGLVAAGLVARRLCRVDALVLTSPTLATRLNPAQKLLMAVVPRLAPDLRVGNGVDPRFLTHDSKVVDAYKADPLVHDRISGRLARFIQDEPPLALEQAPHWRVPTLLVYAGDDQIVDPAGSRQFARAAPRDMVTSRCFQGMYHELFHEIDPRPVFDCLKQWLDARF